MSIVQGSTTTFAKSLLNGNENFTTGTYYIALYNANANLDNTTTVYTTQNEVSGTGYTAGGKALTISVTPTIDNLNNVAYISFANVTWNPASFTARGALVYNYVTKGACFALNFGSDKTCSNSFTVQFPAATSTSAILSIGSYTSAAIISSGD
jgi:hypothetical protein